MSPIPIKSYRHPGAPKGNRNALKHGFYSRQFTRSDHKDLTVTSSILLADEINLLRVYLRRFISDLPTELTPDQSLAALRTISFASTALNRLIRTQQRAHKNGDGSPDEDNPAAKLLRYYQCIPELVRLQQSGDYTENELKVIKSLLDHIDNLNAFVSLSS